MQYLRRGIAKPYVMLFDLSAIDERLRGKREGQPASDFTVFYHLMSLDRNEDLRVKVALAQSDCSLPSVTGVYPVANWYEREAFDMFGIHFSGHPNLRRILTPPHWEGHPLRKEHPARATEMDPFKMTNEFQVAQQEELRFVPEEWGMSRSAKHTDFMFLNLGPNHPRVHGVFRIVLQLDGEVIVDAVPEIGYHHRAAEKMGERQSWHTYIPYTDRIDYLGGVMNNLPYVMAVEKLAGITVPDRAKVIRIMLAEFFRISSHLVFYGTFAQDVGQMSPVFYMFADRERLLSIIEAITGGRMHPSWFRIGGVTQDLPQGWDRMVRDFVDYLGPRIDHYDKMVMQNGILKDRTIGIGTYDTAEALEWGVTGPGLRATGLNWDLRKQRPYGGYDQFEFEVPTATERRLLRPLRRARRRDPPEPAHHPPVPREHARRSLQGDAPVDDAAAERTHDARHRNADSALPQRELGTGHPGRRSLDDDRGDEGLELVLPRFRRQHDVVPHAHPYAVVPASADDSADQPRTDGRRPDCNHREHRFRDGRRGPLK